MGDTGSTDFGHRLRRLRLDGGLTQEALAELSGVSVQAIAALEQGTRRFPRGDTIAMLAAALGVDAAALDAPRRPRRPRLPSGPETALVAPVTRLVGRERELAEAAGLLLGSGRRLLTLTGPPGVGKTRLALALADRAGEAAPDTVMIVSLAPLADPQLVATTIGRGLGLRDDQRPGADVLAASIDRRRMLLVLDNFEHLLPAAPLVGELLARCPSLRVLATSRGSLRLRDEQELPVAPLRLSDAVTLFVEHARARWPTFELTADNREPVTEICRRLDGLPLAVELAAPWIKTLGPRELLVRLADRLDLLVGGPQDLPERQRTMRAALRWSYELLDDEERALFRRVSVFAGGATPAAIEAVCGTGERETLHAIAGLVDRSLLLRREVDGEPRLVLLETMREYGLELLEASGELEATAAAHAASCAALVDEAISGMMGVDQARWFARLERELDNLRTALRWAWDLRAAEMGLGMAVGLRRFCDTHGHLRECRGWLEMWLRADVNVPELLRARALQASGELDWRLGDLVRAAELCEASLERYRALDDRRGIARVLSTLAAIAWEGSRYERAAVLCEESQALWRDIGDEWQLAYAINGLALSIGPLGERRRAAGLFREALAIWQRLGEREAAGTVLLNLADLLRLDGHLDQARPLLEDALRMCRELGNVTREASVLHTMGAVAMTAGDVEDAEAWFRDSLRIRLRVGARSRIAQSLEGLAAATACPEIAARMYGFADALRETVGAPRHPFDVPLHDAGVARLRAELGEDRLRREREAGRGWTQDEAASAALGGPGTLSE
ncbi:MAG TPA: tetratricopeptide repeat protein [Candidatus Dormibacteraeota bacterium]